MGVDLFDIVSYPVWKLALLLALSYFCGWFMAYEKINERNNKH